MPAAPKHRDAVVRTAVQLFRRQGYAATGTNQIVAVSGAPKGSLYHYFPGGKEQIAEAAVRQTGETVLRTLRGLLAAGPSPAAALRDWGGLLVGWLGDSDFRDGSPVTTTLLELAPGSVAVTAAGRSVYDAWADLLGSALVADGVAPARAGRLARLTVSCIEGALVVARVEQDGRPVLEAVAELADLYDAASTSRASAG